MTTTPIVACFGIGCACRKQCRAYYEVEAPEASALRLDFCAGAHDGKPVRFIPMPCVIKVVTPVVERRVAHV